MSDVDAAGTTGSDSMHQHVSLTKVMPYAASESMCPAALASAKIARPLVTTKETPRATRSPRATAASHRRASAAHSADERCGLPTATSCTASSRAASSSGAPSALVARPESRARHASTKASRVSARVGVRCVSSATAASH